MRVRDLNSLANAYNYTNFVFSYFKFFEIISALIYKKDNYSGLRLQLAY